MFVTIEEYIKAQDQKMSYFHSILINSYVFISWLIIVVVHLFISIFALYIIYFYSIPQQEISSIIKGFFNYFKIEPLYDFLSKYLGTSLITIIAGYIFILKKLLNYTFIPYLIKILEESFNKRGIKLKH